MDVLQGLNSKQQEAVTAIDGNIRVTAGAGSGKTRVLAHRYAFLVNEVGISPANILCMTFTNKAAQEMKNRIKTMVQQGNVNDFVCTIHGFCVRFLREEIFRLGYPKNFVIIDEEDTKDLAKQVMGEFKLNKNVETVKQFLTTIHKSKILGGYVRKYMLPNATFDLDNKDSFARYLQLQVKLFALDFDDLIYFTLYILDNFESVRTEWQQRLNYIMVDEAQDCSNVEWGLIHHLIGDHHNLFFVGDPDQCIYEWRGSSPKYFIDFPADRDIILNQNYRSTPDILDVANTIISHNQMRIKKDLFTEAAKGKVAVHYHGKSEQDEGNWVATQIDDMVKAGAKYSDFAVLYRASWISRFIEEALLRKQIPYTIWGGIRFFERKEVKDALAYLRILVFQDDLSFRRIINVPSRKFGRASLDKLAKIAEQENTSLFTALQRHVSMFNNNRLLKDFLVLNQQASIYKESHSISDTLDFLLKGSGYKDALRMDGDEERTENLEELFSSIKYYEEVNKNEENLSIVNYLQDIALYTNADYKKDTPTVKLMTIHQAKGLEFPYVFVCCLTEGIFPSDKTIRYRKLNGLEEERRLMYVAVTRAEKALFLTESEGFNHTTTMAKYPSRFLMEIGKDLVQIEGSFHPSLFQGTQMVIVMQGDLSQQQEVQFQIGDKVYHKYFGIGEVISYNEENQSYKVRFEDSVRDITDAYLKKSQAIISKVQIPVEEVKGKDEAKLWNVLAKDSNGDIYRIDAADTKEEAYKKALSYYPSPDGSLIYISDVFEETDDEDDFDDRQVSNYDEIDFERSIIEEYNKKKTTTSETEETIDITINEVNDIMKFKGVDIRSTVEDFLNGLKEKGFYYPHKWEDDGSWTPQLNEGEIEISGKLAGYECRGMVRYTLKSHQIFNVHVTVEKYLLSLTDAKNFLSPFITKYGEPSSLTEDDDPSCWRCSASFDNEDGYVYISCSESGHYPSIMYHLQKIEDLGRKERDEQFLDEI